VARFNAKVSDPTNYIRLFPLDLNISADPAPFICYCNEYI